MPATWAISVAPDLMWPFPAFTGAMTQQPQEDFDRSVEDAQAWMKVVQEQLQVNDNTKGPRAALEARLRETEVGSGLALLALWHWMSWSFCLNIHYDLGLRLKF